MIHQIFLGEKLLYKAYKGDNIVYKKPPYNPTDLFKNGEKGVWFDPSEKSYLYKDLSETAITSVGDPVGMIKDISPNNVNISQAVSAKRPTYTQPGIKFDKIDDSIEIMIPSGGINGTLILGTDAGTAAYGVSIPEGKHNIGFGGTNNNNSNFPGTIINGYILRDGIINSDEKDECKQYIINNGSASSFGGVTDFSNYWANSNHYLSVSILTSFPLIDTSAGTNFTNTWAYCSSLTSFPLIDTSAGTNFSYAWYGCSKLTSFPLINTSNVTNFTNTWANCSSLTSFPLIVTSAGTNFTNTWANCSSLTSFPLIDTSTVTNFSEVWNNCKSLTSFPLIVTSAGTNFYGTWANCSKLTSFPLINTSNVTNFTNTWANCSSLTSFPLIDTSAGTNFSLTWYGCSKLTSFPSNMFDNVKDGDFYRAFSNTNLNQESIDGILISLVTSGISTGTREFDQSGGSAPSSIGNDAIDILRSRGWTITVTGSY